MDLVDQLLRGGSGRERDNGRKGGKLVKRRVKYKGKEGNVKERKGIGKGRYCAVIKIDYNMS